jgi:hypothetical protein
VSALLTALRKRGWVIRDRTDVIPLLPDDVRARYPSVPPAVSAFLEGFDVCQNADENVWFLSPADFRRTDPDGFRWNECELMALENDEGDAAAQAAVRAFWNAHLPIMMAVHSDYDYLAVRLTEPGAGSIVHGCAPDWEEPSRVAGSFEEFLQSFTAEAASSNAEYPYSVFL